MVVIYTSYTINAQMGVGVGGGVVCGGVVCGGVGGGPVQLRVHRQKRQECACFLFLILSNSRDSETREQNTLII